LRFLQQTPPFSHLRRIGDSPIRIRPFRHPLPKLPRPGFGRVFFCPLRRWRGKAFRLDAQASPVTNRNFPSRGRRGRALVIRRRQDGDSGPFLSLWPGCNGQTYHIVQCGMVQGGPLETPDRMHKIFFKNRYMNGIESAFVPISVACMRANRYFALAKKGGVRHIETAFQASSPKTFKARPAMAGLFLWAGGKGQGQALRPYSASWHRASGALACSQLIIPSRTAGRRAPSRVGWAALTSRRSSTTPGRTSAI